MLNSADIREHMDVIGADGKQVGTVDHMDGTSRIKLTKSDSGDGKHHFIPLDWVDHIDAHVHLKKSSQDAMTQWQ